MLKPFVFLDFFNAKVEPGFGFGMHPHSGIATLTWQPGCDVRYQDTTGKNGLLKAGGLEWMNAAGGAWHQATLETDGWATGFQLWVAMPPGIEDGESLGQYTPPEDVPKQSIKGGALTLLLGKLETEGGVMESPISSHQDMNYFVLELEAQSQWDYEPPVQHDVTWAFVFEGSAAVNDFISTGELLLLDGNGFISFAAGSDKARILVGTARKHPYKLVLGPSSVHTNAASLVKAQARIKTIRENLVLHGIIQS
jgi:redox-sensitive bicupin YhaK (pirin superfamily)